MSLLGRVLPLLCFAISMQAALPPVIDRDAFFGEIQIAGAQLSPDGQYISFLKPYKGVRNIWLKKADQPFANAKPMSAESKRPVPAYFWSRDSKYLLYAQDQGGDENFNVYAVDPTAQPDSTTGVPPARNLTDAKGARAEIFSLPKSDPGVMYIGLNDRDKAWHDLYKVNIATGQRTLLRKNTDRIAAWIFDNKGVLRLAFRTDDKGNTEFLRVDPDKFTQIYSCSVFESCGPAQFDENNQKLYIESNKGNADLIQLELLNPSDGSTTPVESDPDKRVDLDHPIFSEKTDKLIATVYEDDKLRIYWRSPKDEADDKWMRGQLPGMEFRYLSSTSDETKLLVEAYSDVEPGQAYLFDRTNRKLTPQYRVREEIPRDALSPMQAIRYKSSDGTEISAYLTLPKGVEPKNLPLVVFPHGGPWARDSWGYSTFPQFFANRGYAVLQPNFRGSTGFGKKFLNAGNGEWGRKMQDDLTWGVKYLVAQGTVNPKRVGIAGGSYGGYATLAGVAFTPDLYAGAVSIVGPSNLVTLLGSIPPYWEAGRKIMYARMADPGTPEGKKTLESESPLFSADKIRTPLMVVQGANDPRVNKRESDQIVIAVRDRGLPIEYLVAPDEGHGFRRPINNLAMVMAMEQFLSKHLDGRFQEGGTPETITRLKEITVDPKTVAIAAKVDPAKSGAPSPARQPAPGASTFKVTVAAGGQTIPLQLVSEIKPAPGGYAASETMQTPGGPATDNSVLEADKLTPKERHVKQGPFAIDLTYTGSKVSGTMTMNGQSKPVEVTLDVPAYADGAGAVQSIAALPLADGYTASYSNVDLMQMKPKVMSLRVAGSEQVTVPAGAFDCFKVEVMQADGSPGSLTVWVAKDKHQAVKYAAVVPEMGGAQLTAELAQ